MSAATAGTARIRVDNIPAEHRAQPRWVRFDLARDVMGRIVGKTPYIPGTTFKASVDDPATWRGFEEAMEDADRRSQYAAYAFGADSDETFFDLDKVVGPHGATKRHAQTLADTLDTYTEVSASGSGLHIVCRGRLPKRGRSRPDFWPQGEPFEVYPKNGGRFCVYTGDTRPGIGSLDGRIEARQDVLLALFPPRDAKPPDANANGAAYHGSSGELTDDELDSAVEWGGNYWDDGRRHHMALYYSGYLGKQGVPREQALRIIGRCSVNDYDPGAKFAACNDTYDNLEAGDEVGGYRQLQDTCGLTVEELAPLAKILDGFWQRTHPRTARDDGRPVINIGDQDLERGSKACWDAIERANDPPRMFTYGAIPTRIGRDEDSGSPVPQPLDVSRLRHAAARAATFIRKNAKGEVFSARPAEAVIKDMLADPTPPLPTLIAITEVPVFGPDGSLPSGPGYHEAARTFYAPARGFEAPRIAGHPTPQDVAAARRLIQEELFGDFPFIHEAERTHAAALLLLRFARNLIDGPTPLHLVEKPAPGTGATLLIDAIALIQTGRPAPAMTEGRDEDDMRKRLTANLLKSPGLVFFDNLRKPLDYSCLAAAITETRWVDRLLGTSTVADIRIQCAWAATGNNPQVSNEMTRRSIGIRLDAKLADPWLRSDFRHPNLRAWIKARRAELVGACLTLVRAWIVQGRPAPRDLVTIGMFEEWSAVMGGILEVAGFEGFLANRENFYNRADTESDDVRGFLLAWWEEHRAAKVKVSTLFAIASAPDSTLDIEAKNEQGQRVRLGRILAAIEDRRYRLTDRLTVRVLRTGEKEKGAVLWRLDPGESGPENGPFGESHSQDSPTDSPGDSLHSHAEIAEAGESGESFLYTQRVVSNFGGNNTYTGSAEKDSPDSPDETPAVDDCLRCGAVIADGQAVCRDCDPRGR